MHLRILPDHQKPFLKKIFLNVWRNCFESLEWLKTRRTEKVSDKKDIFERLEWLKTCFDAFAHTPRPPKTFFQKRYFGTFVVVKNVFWCICAYFQTTKNIFLKKDIFEYLEWLKTCFDAFSHTPRPPETVFFKKDIFYWLE